MRVHLCKENENLAGVRSDGSPVHLFGERRRFQYDLFESEWLAEPLRDLRVVRSAEIRFVNEAARVVEARFSSANPSLIAPSTTARVPSSRYTSKFRSASSSVHGSADAWRVTASRTAGLERQ